MTRSAGLIPYRRRPRLEVLVAHPGGPFWQHQDAGAWSMVKGVVEDGEDPRRTAEREFEEETGWAVPSGPWLPLGEATLKSGKRLVAWAVEADYEPEELEPGTFTMEWRGRTTTFPEIDRVAWFPIETAREKLNPAYGTFLDELERRAADAG